ncbi:MAG: hypothetical protein GTN80_05455, partial [Nitrososphaeria archaeon]|nr:hypothetical protein [Nitrososphaeria archaeon]NIN52562.1 hypothetical protein [Nitrososphaeria archaeon]NIQ33069.1 hypothetical protein [Nitrososphaeria archaeon]
EMWKQLAERIRTEKGNYLILGKVDSGKSSLTVFLVNRCLEKKLRVGVVDADLGQGDLGEPGLIGAAVPDEKITSLEDIRDVERRFIGTTSPHGVEEELENAIKDLYGWLKGKNCEVIFINFHGWV